MNFIFLSLSRLFFAKAVELMEFIVVVVVCRVNELEYEDVIDPNPKIKVTADHIDKVFHEAIKVGVKIDF